MKMNPVVHFEMPADDLKRVARFYADVFGWNMNQLGAQMGNYLLAGTTETDEKQMVKTPGTINGGFYPRQASAPGYGGTHVVISVPDLTASIENVKNAGGKIVGDVMDIPGIGKYASFTDTEGNTVGMLQPLPMQGV